MKPSWDDAPEWANYLAMDEDGEWWWYEMEPIKRLGYWSAMGMKSAADQDIYQWEESLEKRP